MQEACPGVTMERRKFLAQTAAWMVGAAAYPASFALQTSSRVPEVQVALDPAKTLAVIPSDFMGLGYEISVARPGLLSAYNAPYVQLVRTLETSGVIRVGGNTSDYASCAATAQPLSLSRGQKGRSCAIVTLHA